jgi:transcriptional regulator with GAF, ATPase, and Fis domain
MTMADKNESLTESLKQSIDNIAKSVRKTSDLLDQFFSSLGKHNLGPPVFLTGTLKKMVQDVENLQNNSQRAVVELQRSQELLTTLNVMTSSLELDHVLENVMDSVVSLTGAERAYLMLYDDAGKLEIRAARNWDRETINDVDASFSQSIINAAIEQESAIITDNAQTDERFGEAKSIMVQQLRSILCIPLMIRGETVGVLYADNRFQQGLFDTKDLPLLTAFGTQAAISIRNARKYGFVRKGLKEAEREIVRLKIEIDEAKRQQDVKRIVESSSFEELRSKALEMRRRRQQKMGE